MGLEPWQPYKLAFSMMALMDEHHQVVLCDILDVPFTLFQQYLREAN